MENATSIEIKNKSIEEFAKDVACLDPIYEMAINDINCFEILKIAKKEIAHSNFLGWLLDPSSSSRIGDQLLKRLLLFCSENNGKSPNKKCDLNAIKIEAMDLDDVIVKREHPTQSITDNKKYIDLLLFSEKNKFCICIENKIDSAESEDQLSNYLKYVEDIFARKDTQKNKYHKYNYDYRYYVLLSPMGIEPKKEKDKTNWISLSYSDLNTWIREIVDKYENDKYKGYIPEKARYLIKDYLHTLGKSIIDGSFQKKCDKIYVKHSEAFDIFEDFKRDENELEEMVNVSNSNKANLKLYHKHRKAIDIVLDNKTPTVEKLKRSLKGALMDKNIYAQYDSKRVSIYIKVPGSFTEDSHLVKNNRNNVDNDFLYYELYYKPSEKVFMLILRYREENCPNGFDINTFDIKNRYVASKKIGSIKIDGTKYFVSDYIENLRNKSKEPSKDEEFIKMLCEQVKESMQKVWDSKKCQEIVEGIKHL